jgi:1-acyl-sn-glycerol-3-phosphate acyltransferase
MNPPPTDQTLIDEAARPAPPQAAERPGPLRVLWGAVATVLSVLSTVIFSFPSAIASFFDHGHAATPILRKWAGSIIRLCGVRVEIEGLEHLDGLGPCVIVSNHQSLFDILAVIWKIPGEVRFVAKKEILKLPVLGFILHKSENVVIDREAGGRAIRRAVEVVRHGYSICVFAEGHRHSDNRVHEFNDGAAWLAILAKIPCVPMAISGTSSMMPRGARFVVPGRRMRIRIGAPIATTGMRSGDRAALTHQLEERVGAMFTTEV